MRPPIPSRSSGSLRWRWRGGAILFTGAIPLGLFEFMAMALRYQWRVMSYLYFMRESYPPFEFAALSADPGTDPAPVFGGLPGAAEPGAHLHQVAADHPHVIALLFVGIAAFFVGIAAFFAVLFTGRWPEEMRKFLVGVVRWSTRVSASST